MTQVGIPCSCDSAGRKERTVTCMEELEFHFSGTLKFNLTFFLLLFWRRYKSLKSRCTHNEDCNS